MIVRLGLVTLLLVGCQEPLDLPSGTLQVLSYNVHGLPDSIAGDDPAGRMPQIAPLLDAYDLVGLQEAWVDDYYDAVTAGRERTTEVRFDQTLDDSRAFGSGLGILADFPERSRHQQHYTTCNGGLDGSSDCLASKGFQRVTLQVGEWSGEPLEIDFWNTHFEAGGGDEDIAARAAQVDDLVTAMLEQSASRAMVFTADQNLHPWRDAPDAEAYTRFTTEVGLIDACDLLDCAEPEHIDKVMFRPGGALFFEAGGWANEDAFFDDEGAPLSDHPAISAELRWQYDLGNTPD